MSTDSRSAHCEPVETSEGVYTAGHSALAEPVALGAAWEIRFTPHGSAASVFFSMTGYGYHGERNARRVLRALAADAGSHDPTTTSEPPSIGPITDDSGLDYFDRFIAGDR